MHRTATHQDSFPSVRSLIAAMAVGGSLLVGAGVYAASPWTDSAGAVADTATVDPAREARRQRVLDIIAQPRESFITYYLTDSEDQAERIRYNEEQLAIDRTLSDIPDTGVLPASVFVIQSPEEEGAILETIELKRVELLERGGPTLQVVDLRIQ